MIDKQLGEWERDERDRERKIQTQRGTMCIIAESHEITQWELFSLYSWLLEIVITWGCNFEVFSISCFSQRINSYLPTLDTGDLRTDKKMIYQVCHPPHTQHRYLELAYFIQTGKSPETIELSEIVVHKEVEDIRLWKIKQSEKLMHGWGRGLLKFVHIHCVCVCVC